SGFAGDAANLSNEATGIGFVVLLAVHRTGATWRLHYAAVREAAEIDSGETGVLHQPGPDLLCRRIFSAKEHHDTVGTCAASCLGLEPGSERVERLHQPGLRHPRLVDLRGGQAVEIRQAARSKVIS